jgi:hypothetical protein
VIRPLPHYRAAGLYAATADDAGFLWSEARGYFTLAAQSRDPVAAARLARLGSAFASMAVALLSEMARATQRIETAKADSIPDPSRGPG